MKRRVNLGEEERRIRRMRWKRVMRRGGEKDEGESIRHSLHGVEPTLSLSWRSLSRGGGGGGEGRRWGRREGGWVRIKE